MSIKHFWDKKPDTMLEWVSLVFASIAFYLFLSNLGYFVGGFTELLRILSPFAGGVVIAFVLNPMTKWFHRVLFRESPGMRWAAILLSYIVAALLLVLLGWLVVPQILSSISILFNSLPGYFESLQKTLLFLQDQYGLRMESVLRILDDSETMMSELYTVAAAAMPQIVTTIGSVASNFVAVFTAVASSIYMLAGKDKLIHQLKTLVHAFLPESVANNTLRICRYTNENFTGFFVGKIIDSLIIGVLTFVLMSILRLDFALLVSVFVGITNIIPVFGPFIGAIPSIFILLLVDPVQALIFAVLILFIQQLDGNFIGPKILGQSIGISSLWVLFSIVVGGDLFGLVGMLIGVPLFATLFGLLHEIVVYLLDRRGIDAEGNHRDAVPPEEPAACEAEASDEGREPATIS